MAEARKHVEREVTEIVTYALTLTAEEAETLRSILGCVAGDQVASPRKHTESVFAALGEAGVPWRTSKELGVSGTLMFKTEAPKATPKPAVRGSSLIEAIYGTSTYRPGV